jgi:uncharacterized repeat protein (TIGR01451 family)/LPXTG-motif cell wall-anchored protein
MLRLLRWLIYAALLAVCLSLIPVAGAAPLAIVPTPTSTPPPPTATFTPAPTNTPGPSPTPTPVPSATPIPPPSATPGPKPSTEPKPSPSPTPTGEVHLTKSADPSTGLPGDTIVFTIVAHNDSSIPATDVEIDDEVPAVFEITGATVSQGTVSVSGQHVHAVVGTIEPGQEVVLRITTVIRPGTPPGSVTNVAILRTTTPGDDPGNNTATATVTIPGPTGSPTPTPGRPPRRLPQTGDTGPSLMLPALLALVALLAGLLLLGRRSAPRGQ